MSETGRGPRRSKAEAGTTLIEALVVVTITTMVSLIAFPKMQQGYLSLAQRQTIAVVAERLREARVEAMRRDSPVSFSVSIDGKVFGATAGAAARTPPGVVVSTGVGRIVFYGDGTATGGVVRVRAANRVMNVTITPLSGTVAVGGSS